MRLVDNLVGQGRADDDDSRDVDKLLDLRARGGIHDVGRTLHVGSLKLLALAPEAEASSGVYHVVTAIHRAIDCSAVFDFALDNLDAQIVQPGITLWMAG